MSALKQFDSFPKDWVPRVCLDMVSLYCMQIHTRSKRTLCPDHLSEEEVGVKVGWRRLLPRITLSQKSFTCLSGYVDFICTVSDMWKPSRTIWSDTWRSGKRTFLAGHCDFYEVSFTHSTEGTQRRVLSPWHSVFGLGNWIMNLS